MTDSSLPKDVKAVVSRHDDAHDQTRVRSTSARSLQAIGTARTLAIHMECVAAELEDPATTDDRRSELIALMENTQTVFEGYAARDAAIRRKLIESIRWAVEGRRSLKVNDDSHDRALLGSVVAFFAYLNELRPEEAVIQNFRVTYPALAQKLEVHQDLLIDAINAWPGHRGPAKGNLPRGPGKWDTLNTLMVECGFSYPDSTAASLQKEWERRPHYPMASDRMRPSVIADAMMKFLKPNAVDSVVG